MAPDKRVIPTLTRTDFRGIETPSYIDEIYKNLYKEIVEKQDKFIKDRLIDKGFHYLIDDIENKIFPKVAIIKLERIPGWSFVYADDGSHKPVFIVGIEDIRFTNNHEGVQYSHVSHIRASFNFTDKEPNI
jgi:hypothetical protein